MSASSSDQRRLPKASLRDSIAVALEVLGPNIAKGLVVRRPKMVSMAQRMKLDRRALRRMQRLRRKYGDGPLLLNLPFRHSAVVLSPDDVRRILDDTPEPFGTATKEKKAALSHFEPESALISHPPERDERRRFNVEALDSDQPHHRLSERFQAVMHEEAERLLQIVAGRGGELTWDEFIEIWYAAVRRVTLGDSARDDDELTDMLQTLRANANWAFLKPKDEKLRGRFLDRVRHYISRAEPGSLAETIAQMPKSETMAPEHQVPQWLFAFDPAGMANFRALALLASHREQAEQARTEVTAREPDLPTLRAAILESLRLWPTTPLVMRETTQHTVFANGVMPAETGVTIFALYFHRDHERLPYANRFAPEVWTDGTGPKEWPLIPFSGGPGICPGRNIVLLTGSHFLAPVVHDHDVELLPPIRLDPRRPLPATLDNYALRFRLVPRAGSPGQRVQEKAVKGTPAI